jgi:hypothetical protein
MDQDLRGGDASAIADIKGSIDGYLGGWKEADEVLQKAGVSDKDRAKLGRLTERAVAGIGKKRDAYLKQTEKVAAAEESHEELVAAEPEEPDYPDEPDEPGPESSDADYDAWEKEMAELSDGHDKAMEEWDNEHDKWSSKFDKSEEKLAAATAKLDDLFDDLSDEMDKHHEALTEEADDVVADRLAALDDDEESDTEPEEPGASK